MRRARQKKKQVTPVDRLSLAMKRLKFTRRNLSEDLGMSLSLVNMYFCAGTKIRLVVALAVQAVYGVRAEWLMEGRGPMMMQSPAIEYSPEATDAASIFERLPRKDRNAALSILRSLASRERTSA